MAAIGVLNALAAAVSRSRQLQYEARIDLDGTVLQLRSLVTTGGSRRDVFGDLLVDSPSAQWVATQVPFLINFGELVKVLDTLDATTAESSLAADIGPETKFVAMVKLGQVINLGDQIDIPYNLIGIQSSTTVGITCQCCEVSVGTHLYPYTKRATFFVKQ